MARLVFDGNYHVYWLDTPPADKHAPTVAEIAAGTELTPFIPKDGFDPGVNNNRVTGGDLSTTFTDESMGTYTSQLKVDFYLEKPPGANTAKDTLVKGATGAIVVCWAGAAAATEPCYVWPEVECGQQIPIKTGENARQKMTADIAVGAEPDMDATVAA